MDKLKDIYLLRQAIKKNDRLKRNKPRKKSTAATREQRSRENRRRNEKAREEKQNGEIKTP